MNFPLSIEMPCVRHFQPDTWQSVGRIDPNKRIKRACCELEVQIMQKVGQICVSCRAR